MSVHFNFICRLTFLTKNHQRLQHNSRFQLLLLVFYPHIHIFDGLPSKSLHLFLLVWWQQCGGSLVLCHASRWLGLPSNLMYHPPHVVPLLVFLLSWALHFLLPSPSHLWHLKCAQKEQTFKTEKHGYSYSVWTHHLILLMVAQAVA